MPRPAVPELISVTEAAGLLGFTRRHVHNLIRDGLLPAQRIGSNFAVAKSDLAKVPKRKRGPKPKAHPALTPERRKELQALAKKIDRDEAEDIKAEGRKIFSAHVTRRTK